MGLDRHGVRLLLEAGAHGVSFKRSVTIGRQHLHLDTESLSVLLGRFGISSAIAESRRILEEEDGFCEPLLRKLGAEEVCSIDFSAYEKATLLHDMNQPIPDSLVGRFSAVVESGSLEHIFNFPVAIANCLRMVALGGHFLAIAPINNQMGHGFYQFSPELFYRVCEEENGFAAERVIAYQDCWPFDQWHAVRDPKKVGRRVTLFNRYPAFLIVQAKRVSDAPPFSAMPQQSDYLAVWDSRANHPKGTSKSGDTSVPLSENIATVLGTPLKRFIATNTVTVSEVLFLNVTSSIGS